MTVPVHTASSFPPLSPTRLAAEQERRKKRLTGILSQDLPTLPAYVMDLNALLSSPTVDLKKVGKVIRGLRRRVISIEQAAILLGTERLRTLVLTCSLMQFAGKRVPTPQLITFWQHSFLTGLLSERIARHIDYFEKEQAYLCGLLHDIGQLPLSILVLEEEGKGRRLPPPDWMDNVALERDYFGMDHCKVGRWMAVAWNFMPSFIDVFESHHTPERAEHDPYLVGIVAAADQFLMTQVPAPMATAASETLPSETPALEAPPAADAAPETQPSPFIQKCLPNLSEADRQSLLEMLQTEYIHLLPLVQLGLASANAAAE